MSTSFDESEYWVLSQGEYLAGLSKQLRATRRRRSFQQKTMCVLLMVFGVGLGMSIAGRLSRIDDSQAFACSDVQQNMQAYVAGTLEQPFRARFEEHLKTCPRCREVLGKLQASNDHEQVQHHRVAVRQHRSLNAHGLVLAKN